jgi:hypothetical protein
MNLNNNTNEKETTSDTNNNFYNNDIQINRKIKYQISNKAENARIQLKTNKYLIEKIENLKSKSYNIKLLLNNYININETNNNKTEIKNNIISDIKTFNNLIKEENIDIQNKIEKLSTKISSLSLDLQESIPEKENLNDLIDINFKLIYDIKKLENIYKRYIEDYKLILEEKDISEEIYYPEETVLIINDMTDELIYFKDELQKKINLMGEINNQNQEKFQLYCNLRNKQKILRRRFNYLKNMKTIIMETDKEYELSTMNQIPVDKEIKESEDDFLFKDFELNSSMNSEDSSLSEFNNKKISEIKEETNENEEKLDLSTINKKEEENDNKNNVKLNRVLSMDLNEIGSFKNFKENFEEDKIKNIKINGEIIENNSNNNKKNNSNEDLYMINKDLKLERDCNNKNYIKLQIEQIKKKHRDSIEKSILEQKKFYKMIIKNLKKENENKKNKIENFELYYDNIKKKFNNEFDNLQDL